MVKVLIINDDNHENYVCTETATFSTVGRFMKEKLLKPHNEEYVIKFVYVCNPPEALDDENFDNDFDVLNCGELNNSRYLEIFNRFWENGDEYRG